MGACLSKKKTPPSSSATSVSTSVVAASVPVNVEQNKSLRAVAPEETVKKEVFLIKQRKSHERRPSEERPNSVAAAQSASPLSSASSGEGSAAAKVVGGTPLRTSSCTKEEVDAILIQCGRLSRSSSGNNEAGGGGRKYSGSKRSFDFDQESNRNADTDETQLVHRRTPTRERDGSHGRRHRSTSASREEERKRNAAQNGGSTSRRLSRSPGRRSDTTTTTSSASASATAGDKSKGPAKMVSVPASTTGAIKRVSVKRATASPRSQSPANARDNAGPSLSRNSSRKADQSPYRRNPLSEIDDNVPKSEQINKKPLAANKTHNTTEIIDESLAPRKPFNFQSQKHNEGGNENSKQPQTITRTRSSRRSKDLDFVNDDVNVPTSYASLLLEDIQNFHQKNSNSNANSNNTAFSLPPCVTKACSILDAVADLNSSTTSNALSDERGTRGSSSNISRSVSPFSAHSRKMSSEVVGKDPLVETEVFVYDDLMEPSIHKYITVRRGAAEGVELEQQESSGSNSIVGQQWFSSSWEPNSADSTDHWSSSSNTRDDVVVDKEEPGQLLVHKKKVFSEAAGRKVRNNSSTHLASVSGKKRELDCHQQVGKPSAAPSL